MERHGALWFFSESPVHVPALTCPAVDEWTTDLWEALCNGCCSRVCFLGPGLKSGASPLLSVEPPCPTFLGIAVPVETTLLGNSILSLLVREEDTQEGNCKGKSFRPILKQITTRNCYNWGHEDSRQHSDYFWFMCVLRLRFSKQCYCADLSSWKTGNFWWTALPIRPPCWKFFSLGVWGQSVIRASKCMLA